MIRLRVAVPLLALGLAAVDSREALGLPEVYGIASLQVENDAIEIVRDDTLPAGLDLRKDGERVRTATVKVGETFEVTDGHHLGHSFKVIAIRDGAARIETVFWTSFLGREPTQSKSTMEVRSYGTGTACRVTESVRAEPPRDPKADPFGSGPWYVNADRTIWAGGEAVAMTAGRKGNKVLWIRPAGTPLTVSGRRLDGAARPLKATLPCCYPTGFQAGGLEFPTEGCWEIAAVAGKSRLTFITKVAPEGGPR